MPETPRDLRCSFCNKSEKEVSQLIAGPHVHICDSCVGIAADIIEHSKRPPSQRRSHLARFLGTLRRVVTWAAGGGRRFVAAHAARQAGGRSMARMELRR
jgi:hypothetical protein